MPEKRIFSEHDIMALRDSISSMREEHLLRIKGEDLGFIASFSRRVK